MPKCIFQHRNDNFLPYTGHSPVGRVPMGYAHSKIARVVFVLYVVGRAY